CNKINRGFMKGDDHQIAQGRGGLRRTGTSSLRFWLLLHAVSFLLASCETRRHLVLETVGPPSSANGLSALHFAGVCYLRVYSATETRHADKFINYYPHTPYTIYTTNGQRFKWVRNSIANMDENPALVRLPAGLYSVRAEDDGYGQVTVPVAIK